MKDLHLITKILFDSEFYTTGMPIKIKTGEYSRNAIIVSNYGEELLVVSVRQIASDENNFINEPYTQSITAEEVSNGDVELITIGESFEDDLKKEIKNTQLITEIGLSFNDVSHILSEREHYIANKEKVKDQGDIDERHDARVAEFHELLGRLYK